MAHTAIVIIIIGIDVFGKRDEDKLLVALAREFTIHESRTCPTYASMLFVHFTSRHMCVCMKINGFAVYLRALLLTLISARLYLALAASS
jgi:hypothetical protein